MSQSRPNTARGRVAQALHAAAEMFPHLDPQPLYTTGLSSRDTALALAIHRAVLQRWLTIEYLLDHFLQQPMAKLDPALRAVLLSGGAQLLFFDRLPPHAVVDESVELARQHVHGKATGLTNAVLRRLAELVVERVDNERWSPAVDRLPLEHGYVQLGEPLLPPIEAVAKHLSVVTSHPLRLVERWTDEYGFETATDICLHGLKTPPIFVQTSESAQPKLWTQSHEELREFLEQDVRIRVQDPTAAAPVVATAALEVHVAIDFCAGRGTKTRQLLATHPNARIFAFDTSKERLADLRRALQTHPAVSIAALEDLPRDADLLVLDVPCSNTGVFARRPEARYRFSPVSVQSIMALQQKIIAESLPLVRPGGHLLYATCSILQEENESQSAHIVERYGAEVIAEQRTLPGGEDVNYHDGGYYALLHLPERRA